MGTRLVVSHTARGWQQTDRVRVWTIAALLSSPSTVQSSRRRWRRRSTRGPKSRRTRLFGLKCLRLKRTQDSLGSRSSSCGGFQHSGSVRVWDFHCRLSFYIHLSFILVLNKHVSKDVEDAIQRLTSTVHRHIIYCFYMWTAKLSNDCESTACHAHLWWVTRKLMAKNRWSCI